MTIRYRCTECGWVGNEDRVLRGNNPFDSTHVILGCPRCLEPNRMERACDVDDCPRPADCGTPTKDGYVHSCGEHQPKEEA